MEFWKPSLRKLATTAILVVVAIVNSCSSNAINDLYKRRMLSLLEQATEQYPKAMQHPEPTTETYEALGKLVRSDEYQRFIQMGRVKWATQALVGLLLAYFAACLIHRREKPKPTTPLLQLRSPCRLAGPLNIFFR